MNQTPAPAAVYGDITLPNTRLHYVRAGDGPPLIIVPATVSLISQWYPMAQFMGRRFTSYFFELPGHGGSTPYPTPFNSRMVPHTVEALADALGFDRFTLMGFSFGGLLTFRTLEHLQHRIDRLILISPIVSSRALKFSPQQLLALRALSATMKNQPIQASVDTLIKLPALVSFFTWLIGAVGKVPKAVLESKNALQIPRSTLDVLAYTLGEILTMEYRPPNGPFSLPCYYAMSLYDDMLDYTLTTELVGQMFTNLTHQQLTLPYHQPPEPPTVEWLDKEFGSLLEMI